MPLSVAVESFLKCLAQSGLVEKDRLEALRHDLAKRGPKEADARAIAAGLVREQALTSWQAENLLRGKRRGFILDKYRLLAPLGRGEMNAVYLGEHSLMHRRCAIKILPAKHLSDKSSVERFHREARAVALLDHTNIVRAYDVGKAMDGSTPIHFFAMELVEGESLEERVSRDGPCSPVEAANFIRQAAEGLAHAHCAGIVHRDIKPSNLLVDHDGVVKILDLGLAKFFGDEAPRAQAFNPYSEQSIFFLRASLDSHTVDGRSDIYSLGCSFYYLLAGRPPFPEGTLTERLVSHLSQAPVPIVEKRPDVLPDLAAILERMLAKKMTDRFQTADELAEHLRQWLVRHADPQWIRKNPAVLTGLRTAKNDPVSPAAQAALPLGGAGRRSDTGAGGSSSEISFELFDPDPSTVTGSIIFRRRPRTLWGYFKRLWKTRPRKPPLNRSLTAEVATKSTPHLNGTLCGRPGISRTNCGTAYPGSRVRSAAIIRVRALPSLKVGRSGNAVELMQIIRDHPEVDQPLAKARERVNRIVDSPQEDRLVEHGQSRANKSSQSGGTIAPNATSRCSSPPSRSPTTGATGSPRRA